VTLMVATTYPFGIGVLLLAIDQHGYRVPAQKRKVRASGTRLHTER